MKKSLSLVLCICLMLTMSLASFADERVVLSNEPDVTVSEGQYFELNPAMMLAVNSIFKGESTGNGFSKLPLNIEFFKGGKLVLEHSFYNGSAFIGHPRRGLMIEEGSIKISNFTYEDGEEDLMNFAVDFEIPSDSSVFVDSTGTALVPFLTSNSGYLFDIAQNAHLKVNGKLHITQFNLEDQGNSSFLNIQGTLDASEGTLAIDPKVAVTISDSGRLIVNKERFLEDVQSPNSAKLNNLDNIVIEGNGVLEVIGGKLNVQNAAFMRMEGDRAIYQSPEKKVVHLVDGKEKSQYYPTIQEALQAATMADTIEILKDIRIRNGESVAIPQNVKLSAKDDVALIVESGATLRSEGEFSWIGANDFSGSLEIHPDANVNVQSLFNSGRIFVYGEQSANNPLKGIKVDTAKGKVYATRDLSETEFSVEPLLIVKSHKSSVFGEQSFTKLWGDPVGDSIVLPEQPQPPVVPQPQPEPQPQPAPTPAPQPNNPIVTLPEEEVPLAPPVTNPNPTPAPTPVAPNTGEVVELKEEEIPLASIRYIDVSEKDWFYDAVRFVTAKNAMKGVGDERFAPRMEMTRG
ncbi:MAG: S-layer homology domain-containing protein, partial [Bacillota bacterium]|nr:S-layer homology domain-containing protein [Bacillota bacterium]